MKMIKTNRNRILAVLVAVLFLSSTNGQNQYLNMSVGGGLHTLQHDPSLGSHTPGIGGTFNVSYVYFFSSHWGLESGLGISYYQSKSKIDGLDESRETDAVNGGQAYYLRSIYSGWEEKQRMITAELPVGIYYRTDLSTKTSLLLGFGGKLTLPFWNEYKVTDGSFETKGYYPFMNVEIFDLPHHKFGRDETRYSDEMDTRLGAALYLDLGLNHWLKNGMGIYWGVYCNYGLTDVMDNHDNKLRASDGSYNGVLASDMVDKTNLLAAGVKLGVTLPFGKKEVQPQETMEQETPLVLPDTQNVVPAVTSDSLPKVNDASNPNDWRSVASLIKNLPEWENFKYVNKADLKQVDEAYAALSDSERDSLPMALVYKKEKLDKQVANTTKEKMKEALSKKDKYSFYLDLAFRDFSGEERAYMKYIADCLKMNPDVKIKITGHTCNIGTAERNEMLGYERALFVRDVMMEMGADSEQIEVETKGQREPVEPNTTEENKSKNRRAVLKLIE
ncbi:MAG: OmpA family protein [Prevotellaceae bacterium]|nr:OmpA family protein [Prevotellaceae bacterium]